MDIPGPEAVRRNLARATKTEFLEGMEYAAPVILDEVQFLLPGSSDLWPKAAHVCFRKLISHQLRWRVKQMPERYIRLLCRHELAPVSKRVRQIGWTAVLRSTGWKSRTQKVLVTLTPSGASALRLLAKLASDDAQVVTLSQLVEFGIKKALSAVTSGSGLARQEDTLSSRIDELSRSVVLGAPQRQ